MIELYVVEVIAATDSEVVVAARCHQGTLRVGDRLSRAVDPQGQRLDIDLECVEIRLSATVLLDELTENYGGSVTLVGSGAIDLRGHWSVYGG